MNVLKNSVRLIGHLRANPEMKEVGNGKKVVRVSLAINETYRNSKGEQVTDTGWHTLVIWGKTAENAQKHLTKGSEIAVEGRLNSGSYVSKAGEKKYFTEIVVNELLMLGRKSQSPS